MADILVPTYVNLTPKRTLRVDNNDFYIPEGIENIKATVLVAGTDITINDVSNTQEYKFSINYNEYIPLTITGVTIQAFISSVEESQPILKGKTIDEITISWTRNKNAATQTLTNVNGTIDASQVSYNENALSISNRQDYVLTVDDGLQRTGSNVVTNISLEFGNTVYYGAGARKDNTPSAGIDTFLQALSTVTKYELGFTVPLTGGDNERMFVAYPKDWGEATILFEGEDIGFRRLLNVNNTTLKYELGGGETESQIQVLNTEGFDETLGYYVYMSEFDNLNGGQITVQL